MNIIDAVAISKKYDHHFALQQLTLGIPQGSIFGLLGPNGAGKTSFIRIITQIISPDSGNINFKGAPLSREHLHLFGYLPEERGLYKKMKVEEQLLYFGSLRNLKKTLLKERVRRWLTIFDLLSWKDKNLETLSKGMQQKVQFIVSILHDPEVIILDEPFSGFDPLNSELLTTQIIKLKSEGKTIIFSTHRMDTVESLCDGIALINQGKCVLEGNIRLVKEKFKNNTYEITGHGVIKEDKNRFTIMSYTNNSGIGTYEIKLSDTFTPNDLLSLILPDFAIFNFHEILPSMHDIFLSQVQMPKMIHE